MKLIVAVSNDWCIGQDNELLQPIKADLKYFKEKTVNCYVICGRKTWESLPIKPLPKRINIILTRDKDYIAEGAIVNSFENILKSDIDLNSTWIIGGAEIYKQFLPYCSEAYITKINTNKQGNKFFPNLDKDNNWECISESPEYEENDIKFKFTVYKNNNVSK